ncbi:unnamed protein product [Brassica napus]|uniref:(rape) hypothetical protein n=1 Tax=Brassica napus TaxID=3708 RepID=A0A817AV37_BRANA|nr:unnamed protein product [Brassica napus]
MANQHFFKPLLPGFHSHLKIPVAFFSKHIEGRNEHKNTAKLRSDTSEITWKVKIEDGLRLTDGWKEFALAHDLRVGDIVIFRQEKDMAFHVTLFGPSCCEIQYGACLDDKNKLVKIQSKKKVKKNTKREVETCTLDPSCYVVNVTPSSLRYDMLYIPKSFARANGLETRSGEIVLMNEKGTSWTLILKRKNSCGTMYITRGWRRFCRVNGLRAGSFFTFKLIQRGGTLVLRKSPSSTESEDSSEGDEIEPLSTESKSFKKTSSMWKASSSPFQNLFVTLTLKPYEVEKSTLKIPVAFFSKHMEGRNDHKNTAKLRSEASEMTWKVNIEDGRRLTEGWKEFALAHDLRVGDIVIFRQERDMSFHVTLLGPSCCEIQYGSCIDQDNNLEKIQKKNPKREEAESSCFVANVTPSNLRYDRLESDEDSNHISSQERIEREDKKGGFVTLTVKPSDFKNSRLYLPMAFTKDNGINAETKLALLDKNGVKWSTDLRSEYNGKRIRMIGGWKKFFKANFLKIGEPIMFKLIWDGNTSCVLKLCS